MKDKLILKNLDLVNNIFYFSSICFFLFFLYKTVVLTIALFHPSFSFDIYLYLISLFMLLSNYFVFKESRREKNENKENNLK